MSHINPDYLKQSVAKIERLELEKIALLEDIKQVYAEAKSNGFDTKILKMVIKIKNADASKLEEQEELIDLYKHALGMV